MGTCNITLSLTPKILPVNNDDVDHDGVPNFADGYDHFRNAGANAGGTFRALGVEIDRSIDLSTAKIRFTYSSSDPGGVSRSGPVGGPYIYTPAGGDLRIWRKNGMASRHKASPPNGDFVLSHRAYSPANLLPGYTFTLYVEGINPVRTNTIVAELAPDGNNWVCSNAVNYSVVSIDLDVDSDYDGSVTPAGLDDSLEVTNGGLVCISNECEACEATIVIEKCLPQDWIGLVRLTPPDRPYVQLYLDNELIMFDGADNMFANTDLPVTLKVKGIKWSGAPRDVKMQLLEESEGQLLDEIRMTVVGVDLDVDSDNSGGWTTPPSGIDEEDAIENVTNMPGKILPVNDGDVDEDGVPNFADGFGLYGDATSGGSLTPMTMDLSPAVSISNAYVRLVYEQSDPRQVQRSGEPPAYIYTPGAGGLRVWEVDGTAERNCLDPTNDPFIVSGRWHKWTDFGGGRTVTLYVEGIAPGKYSIAVFMDPDGTNGPYEQECRDIVNITVFDAGIVPDWNHDRVIDSLDENHASATNPFRFWKNDDDDFGDIAEGDSDVPGQGGLVDKANCDDDKVNGRCDLLDFFPVWLDLNQILNLLPPSNEIKYKLTQGNEAVRIVYTDLAKGQAGDYLIKETNTYGFAFNQDSYKANTIEITSSGELLNDNVNFIDKIKNDASKGVLMVEGRRATIAPLVLEIWKNEVKIHEEKLPLSIDGVEKMYRWINLRHATGGSEIRATDTNEPANYPDAYCNGKQFVFVHGYRVSENAAHGWNAEMFKRLYQAGSRAMFTAVTWFGNEGQVPEWIPWLGGSTPDYYANVVNAFETSSNLAAAVTSLSGQKYIAGHSLGNMLVSSALKDNGLIINTYFMIDAATAKEAYDQTACDRTNMWHSDWQNYSNRLWASEWYQLFMAPDARHNLTWRGRFAAISGAYNYYSSTEDVLDNGDGNLHNPLVSHWAWYNQEVRKGTTLMWLAPGNCEGGWGFNAAYTNDDGSYPLLPAAANALTADNIRTNSLFGWFDEDTLYGTNGSAVAQQPAVYRRLLADGIPALSFAMGRNDLSGFGTGAHDLWFSFRRGNYPSGWPRTNNDWQHSDIKNIAYPFNYPAFNELVNDGALNE